MKKFFTLTLATIAAVTMCAQVQRTEMRVWVGDKIAYQKSIADIDSITFVEAIVPEHEGGVLPGSFSVSANRIIHFSQGNLQYQASTQTWRFAENQYDYIGADNINISSSYSGWIDLFGWGTGNNPTFASPSDNDYTTFSDWGTNAISNGGNMPSTWRTLTRDEWFYLFYTRSRAVALFALGSVNGVNGVILLPDDWVQPEGVTFTPSILNDFRDIDGGKYGDPGVNHYVDNTYTIDQWAVMEAAGAVFFPAAGYRSKGTEKVGAVNDHGFYWASTVFYGDTSYFFGFHSDALCPIWGGYRREGYSVRLVQ